MLKEYFKRFVAPHIIADCPPALDDELNYGRTADRIAARTGHHPAYVKRQLDQWEAFGIDTSPQNLPALLRRYRARESALAPTR